MDGDGREEPKTISSPNLPPPKPRRTCGAFFLIPSSLSSALSLTCVRERGSQDDRVVESEKMNRFLV